MYELQRKIKLKTTLAFFSLFTTWTPSYFPVYTRYVKVQPNYVINLFPIRYYDHQKLRDFVILYSTYSYMKYDNIFSGIFSL